LKFKVLNKKEPAENPSGLNKKKDKYVTHISKTNIFAIKHKKFRVTERRRGRGAKAVFREALLSNKTVFLLGLVLKVARWDA